MSLVPQSFDLYRAAWNANDANDVRPLLEKSVAKDVLFVDPANTARGIDELEALILRTHAAMPGAEYGLASGIDGHSGRYRYRWEVRPNASQKIPGMDFVTLDENGLLQRHRRVFRRFRSGLTRSS